MTDRSKNIFGNVISGKDYKKALKSKAKFIRKFGDDSDKPHPAILVENPTIGPLLGVKDIRIEDGKSVWDSATTESQWQWPRPQTPSATSPTGWT